MNGCMYVVKVTSEDHSNQMRSISKLSATFFSIFIKAYPASSRK